MLNRQCYFNLVTILQQIFWCYVFLFQNEQCAKPQVCDSVILPNNCQIIKYQLPYSDTVGRVEFSLFILESCSRYRYSFLNLDVIPGLCILLVWDDSCLLLMMTEGLQNPETERHVVT